MLRDGDVSRAGGVKRIIMASTSTCAVKRILPSRPAPRATAASVSRTRPEAATTGAPQRRSTTARRGVRGAAPASLSSLNEQHPAICRNLFYRLV